jgi:hypothetical protein
MVYEEEDWVDEEAVGHIVIALNRCATTTKLSPQNTTINATTKLVLQKGNVYGKILL